LFTVLVFPVLFLNLVFAYHHYRRENTKTLELLWMVKKRKIEMKEGEMFFSVDRIFKEWSWGRERRR